MMAKSSRRKIGRLKKDRISELPQNVQETILCFLPIRDAVRTSILSRAWEDLWTMIPHLNFDREFICSMMKKFIQYKDRELMVHKIVSVINKVLLLHNGPILKFSLIIPQDCHHDETAKIVHDYIDQWIPLLSRNGIKQLILDGYDRGEVIAHHFSYLELTHLRLFSVWFPYEPKFGRFSYLTNLELIDATSDYPNFNKGILDCPMLEKLTLVICEGLFPNNFRAPKLKCLHQVYSRITSEYSLAGLENLKEYSFLLLGRGVLNTQDLISETTTSILAKILDGVHNIEKFSIASNFNKFLAAGGSPNRLCKPLPYLKTLNISHINFNDLYEISWLFCLIQSAPNLRTLHLSAGPEPEEGKYLKNYRNKDSETCTISHLKIVTFSNFEGREAELELVKFLLAHSPLLETMFIHYRVCLRSNVAEKMLQYCRSSSRAQIIRLENPVTIDEFDHELRKDYNHIYV